MTGREVPLTLMPGVFFATGADAKTEKLTGPEIFWQDVADRISTAEKLLIEDKKLVGVERRRFESHLADLKNQAVSLAALGKDRLPTFGEMNIMYRSILTLSNFSFRKVSRDSGMLPAREGKARKDALRTARHDGLIKTKWPEGKTNIFIMDLVNKEIIAKTKAGEKPDIFKTPKRFNKRVAALLAAGELSPKLKK